MALQNRRWGWRKSFTSPELWTKEDLRVVKSLPPMYWCSCWHSRAVLPKKPWQYSSFSLIFCVNPAFCKVYECQQVLLNRFTSTLPHLFFEKSHSYPGMTEPFYERHTFLTLSPYSFLLFWCQPAFYGKWPISSPALYKRLVESCSVHAAYGKGNDSKTSSQSQL